MHRDRYAPVAITAAVTGGDVLPSQSPAIPCGPDAIVTEAVAATEAGAAIVHLHAREADGRPTGSAQMFREIVAGIRERTDAVISVSTGGAPGMTAEERLAGIVATKPELATYNLGTMNYEGFPTPERWPSVQHDWERAVLEESGRVVFTNTLAMLRDFAATMKDIDATPELEVYDLGHLNMARFLLDEGTLEPPVRVQYVLGVLGGAGRELQDLVLLHDAADRILGDALGVAGVAATGFPMQFRHAALGFGLGLDVRVGLEDSLRVRRDEQAKSNSDLVEVAVTLAEPLARPLATPEQVVAELGPWCRPAGRENA